MCAGGLQLLDPVSAAILIQFLQQMPLAPMACGNVPAMYMGNMNGPVPPQYAAYNGTEDKASVHQCAVEHVCVHKAEVQQILTRMSALARVALKTVVAGLVVRSCWQPGGISVRQHSTPAACLPEPQLLAVRPAAECIHGMKVQQSRASAAFNKEGLLASGFRFMNLAAQGCATASGLWRLSFHWQIDWWVLFAHESAV